MTEPTEQRMSCRTPDCTNTMQAATAKRNDGYCAPCKSRIDRETREKFVRENRKDVDRFAGVTDPVEMIWLIHTPPKHDPLANLIPPPKTLEDLYASMSSADADRLVDRLVQSGGKSESHSVGQCLAAFTDFPRDQMLEKWLKHFGPYPHELFRGAGPDIRDHLIRSLSGAEFAPGMERDLTANHALSALAWIGDEVVFDFLRKVTRHPPAWVRSICISAADYARVAGWEIAGEQRRELTLKNCVALYPEADARRANDAIRVMQPREDSCPWCCSKLANLIEVDITKCLPSEVNELGDYFEVVTCPICTCYGEMHGVMDQSGRSRLDPSCSRPKYLHAENDKQPEEWKNEWTTTLIQCLPRSRYQAVDWLAPTGISQIGGLPGWVQDVEYPRCLKCQKTMVFIAQIDNSAFDYGEGIYYAFICAGCRTTATCYQQT